MGTCFSKNVKVNVFAPLDTYHQVSQTNLLYLEYVCNAILCSGGKRPARIHQFLFIQCLFW